MNLSSVLPWNAQAPQDKRSSELERCAREVRRRLGWRAWIRACEREAPWIAVAGFVLLMLPGQWPGVALLERWTFPIALILWAGWHGLNVLRRLPGSIEALATWDRAGGRHEIMASALAFERVGLNSVGERHHHARALAKLREIRPALSSDLPIRLTWSRWVGLLLLTGIVLSGALPSNPAVHRQPLPDEVKQRAAVLGAELERMAKELVVMEEWSPEEQEMLQQLKQQISDLAQELQQLTNQRPEEILQSLEQGAQAAEQAEQQLSHPGQNLSDAFLNALEQREITRLLAQALRRDDRPAASREASQLAQRLRDGEALPAQDLRRALTAARLAASSADLRTPSGSLLMKAGDQLQQRHVMQAAATLDHLANILAPQPPSPTRHDSPMLTVLKNEPVTQALAEAVLSQNYSAAAKEARALAHALENTPKGAVRKALDQVVPSAWQAADQADRQSVTGRGLARLKEAHASTDPSAPVIAWRQLASEYEREALRQQAREAARQEGMLAELARYPVTADLAHHLRRNAREEAADSLRKLAATLDAEAGQKTSLEQVPTAGRVTESLHTAAIAGAAAATEREKSQAVGRAITEVATALPHSPAQAAEALRRAAQVLDPPGQRELDRLRREKLLSRMLDELEKHPPTAPTAKALKENNPGAAAKAVRALADKIEANPPDLVPEQTRAAIERALAVAAEDDKKSLVGERLSATGDYLNQGNRPLAAGELRALASSLDKAAEFARELQKLRELAEKMRQAGQEVFNPPPNQRQKAESSATDSGVLQQLEALSQAGESGLTAEQILEMLQQAAQAADQPGGEGQSFSDTRPTGGTNWQLGSGPGGVPIPVPGTEIASTGMPGSPVPGGPGGTPVPGMSQTPSRGQSQGEGLSSGLGQGQGEGQGSEQGQGQGQGQGQTQGQGSGQGGLHAGTGSTQPFGAPTSIMETTGLETVTLDPTGQGESSSRFIQAQEKKERAVRGTRELLTEFIKSQEEALADEPLPAGRRRQIMDYFNQIRRQLEQ